jgi:hypothetical protein
LVNPSKRVFTKASVVSNFSVISELGGGGGLISWTAACLDLHENITTMKSAKNPKEKRFFIMAVKIIIHS